MSVEVSVDSENAEVIYVTDMIHYFSVCSMQTRAGVALESCLLFAFQRMSHPDTGKCILSEMMSIKMMVLSHAKKIKTLIITLYVCG